MGFYATGQDLSGAYLDYPIALRRKLESTLVNLLDETRARERFLDIVRNGVDTVRAVAELYRQIQEGRTHLEENPTEVFQTGQKFLNYNRWYLDRNNPGLCQLDIFAACHPDKKSEWEKVVHVKKTMPLCYFGNCSLTYALAIPLSLTKVLMPDEDGYSEEYIIPELHVFFPENIQLFSLYYRRRNLWSVVNSCSQHKNKQSLTQAIEKRVLVLDLPIEHAFPDLIFDEETLRNPPGMTIDESEYLVK